MKAKSYWNRGKLTIEILPDWVKENKLTEEGKMELIRIINQPEIPHTLFTKSQVMVIVSFLGMVLAWALSLWMVLSLCYEY